MFCVYVYDATASRTLGFCAAAALGNATPTAQIAAVASRMAPRICLPPCWEATEPSAPTESASLRLNRGPAARGLLRRSLVLRDVCVKGSDAEHRRAARDCRRRVRSVRCAGHGHGDREEHRTH